MLDLKEGFWEAEGRRHKNLHLLLQGHGAALAVGLRGEWQSPVAAALSRGEFARGG